MDFSWWCSEKPPGEDAPGQVDFPEAPSVSVCWKLRKQENQDEEAGVIQLTDRSTSASTDTAASQLQVSYNQTFDTCPQRREKGLHWEDNGGIALLSTIQGLHSRAVNISKSLLKPEKQPNKAISFLLCHQDINPPAARQILKLLQWWWKRGSTCGHGGSSLCDCPEDRATFLWLPTCWQWHSAQPWSTKYPQMMARGHENTDGEVFKGGSGPRMWCSLNCSGFGTTRQCPCRENLFLLIHLRGILNFIWVWSAAESDLKLTEGIFLMAVSKVFYMLRVDPWTETIPISTGFLTCHNRGSAGVANSIHTGSVVLKCPEKPRQRRWRGVGVGGGGSCIMSGLDLFRLSFILLFTLVLYLRVKMSAVACSFIQFDWWKVKPAVTCWCHKGKRVFLSHSD